MIKATISRWQLFYITTNVYQQAKGNIKDMQKWAFEIFSTFLANGAVNALYNNLKLDKNYQTIIIITKCKNYWKQKNYGTY